LHWFDVKVGIAIFSQKKDENNFVECKRDSGSGSKELYPEMKGAYSWWSYRASAREKNVGWRIDYFLVSKLFISSVKTAFILNEIMGSDHCPVGIEIQF